MWRCLTLLPLLSVSLHICDNFKCLEHKCVQFLNRNTVTMTIILSNTVVLVPQKRGMWIRHKTLSLILFYLEGLHADPENIFQSSLSFTTRFPSIIAPSSPKLSTSICWRLTLRTVRVQIFAQVFWSSNLWVLFKSVFWFWHKANSVRHFSTYGVLSPRRCWGSNWWRTLSKAGSSLLGRLTGYLDISWLVICNLENTKWSN